MVSEHVAQVCGRTADQEHHWPEPPRKRPWRSGDLGVGRRGERILARWSSTSKGNGAHDRGLWKPCLVSTGIRDPRELRGVAVGRGKSC